MKKSKPYTANDLASRKEFFSEELRGAHMIMTFFGDLTKLGTGSYPEPSESNPLSHTLLQNYHLLMRAVSLSHHPPGFNDPINIWPRVEIMRRKCLAVLVCESY
jgi:hypothetical protein